MRRMTNQVLAHERVEVESILDGPHQKNLERLAQDMEDSLRIYGRRCSSRRHRSLLLLPTHAPLLAARGRLYESLRGGTRGRGV